MIPVVSWRIPTYSCRISMNSYACGFLCIPMDSYSIAMYSYAYSIPMDFYSIPLDSSRFLWFPMDPSGFILEFYRKDMDFYRTCSNAIPHDWGGALKYTNNIILCFWWKVKPSCLKKLMKISLLFVVCGGGKGREGPSCSPKTDETWCFLEEKHTICFLRC